MSAYSFTMHHRLWLTSIFPYSAEEILGDPIVPRVDYHSPEACRCSCFSCSGHFVEDHKPKNGEAIEAYGRALF
ncbi:hypothetical protein Tco_0026436 [Tanacetum coccineum]